MNYTVSEENYIKSIFHLQGKDETVTTTQLAGQLNTRPASVTDMMKRLKSKKLLHYQPYKGFRLSAEGNKVALGIIRRHRLWEYFLAEKLHFTWDEVHEVAEQLEHIQSKKLIDQLDRFLGFPTVDPHGEIIPNARGEFKMRPKTTLSEVGLNEKCEVIGVKDDSAEFLQYADKLGCTMHAKIKVLAIQSFDQSMELEIKKQKVMVSSRFAENIYIHRLNR